MWTDALTTAFVAVGSSLLTIAVTPWVQNWLHHHFWKYQRKLMVGRLAVTPNQDRNEFRITGTGLIEPLLEHTLGVPKALVTPAGSARFRLTVPLRTVFRRAA